ncbi:MAG: pyruvate formate lyase family protein [Desulfomicrobium escambiense]|nr:pyruvate formate lyase family protein [Desulfomicrobium escambiense]
MHLGTITELNGWDAMSPGHLDQHLTPVLREGPGGGTAHPGDRQGAPGLLLDKGEQHPRAAQGRRHRRGKRNLQRLHEHQPRRADARTAGTAPREVSLPHPGGRWTNSASSSPRRTCRCRTALRTGCSRRPAG